MTSAILPTITDRRLEPRIPTLVVAKAALVMFLARMGSLNALQMSGDSLFWKKWLAAPMPSADTVARVYSKMDAGPLREAIHEAYECLKRNKALPDDRGFSLAIVDGHESHVSYRRHCSGCLERTVHFATGDRIQYWRKNLKAHLSPAGYTWRKNLNAHCCW